MGKELLHEQPIRAQWSGEDVYVIIHIGMPRKNDLNQSLYLTTYAGR